jgi:signal transduction histidine kinase
MGIMIFIKTMRGHLIATFYCTVCILLLCVSCTGKVRQNSEISQARYDSIALLLELPKSKAIPKADELKVLNQALEKVTGSIPEEERSAYLILLGERYYALRDYDKFLRISRELQKHASALKDTFGIAKSYYNFGKYYFSAGLQMDSAYRNYYKAEKLYAGYGANLEAGKSMLSMAIVQKNVKDYVGAEESSVDAIAHFDLSTDMRLVASAYNNLGIIAKDTEQYDRAIDYHQKALAFRRQLKGSGLIAVSSLSNLGVVYMNKGDYESAIRYYEEGLAYDSLAIKSRRTYARLLDNLAYAKFMSGDTNDLPALFLTPLRIRGDINDRLGMITNRIHLSEYYRAQEVLDSAQFYAEEAFVSATRLKYNRGILESLALLTEVAPAEKARRYAQKRMIISDSLQRVERSYQDQFARTRYETDTLAIEKEEATQRIRLLTLVLLAALIAFLIGYIFIQQKIARTRLRFQKEQQSASDEITNLMMEQHVKLEEGKQLEKHRISEELHDGVLARLFGIRLNLDSLNRSDHNDDVQSRAKYLEDLKDLGREIRTISHELNAQTFDSKMLYVDVVEKMIEAQSGALNFTFSSEDAIDWSVVANPTKAHLYRVIQEGIQNVHKHEKATAVTIAFMPVAEGIELSMSDNGKGMETTNAKKGIGLKNMAARVLKINGVLSLHSEVGKGTTVRVQFR